MLSVLGFNYFIIHWQDCETTSVDFGSVVGSKNVSISEVRHHIWSFLSCLTCHLANSYELGSILNAKSRLVCSILIICTLHSSTPIFKEIIINFSTLIVLFSRDTSCFMTPGLVCFFFSLLFNCCMDL